MKHRVLLAVVLALALVAVGCGGSELAGLWIDVDDPNYQLTFNADGTGSQDAYGETFPITWERQDDELCITYDDGSSGCLAMSLDGDRMALEVEGGGLGMRRLERWTE